MGAVTLPAPASSQPPARPSLDAPGHRQRRLAARLPAGIQLAARQLRIGWLRRLPLLYGQMARRPVPGEFIRRWTEPVLRDPGIRRDLLAYCRGAFDKAALIRDTEALQRFQGDTLVLWSPDNKVMPAQHGYRLAAGTVRGDPRRVRAVHARRTRGSGPRDREVPHRGPRRKGTKPRSQQPVGHG